MNDDFYNFLVATSKLEEFGIHSDFQEQDLKYNRQRLEELKKRKNENQ